jgi:hypothetical protein
MNEELRYIWKYYLRPLVLGMSPNSKEGLMIRVEKLCEDNHKRKETQEKVLDAIKALGKATGFQISRKIQEQTNSKHMIGFGTLYLALDNLLQNGLITGEWEGEGENRRKYWTVV